MSQWLIDRTRPAMPSHLCRRYILSSPPSWRSRKIGRTASSMARLITPMPRMPVYWLSTLRQANNPCRLLQSVGSACHHNALSTTRLPQKVYFKVFIESSAT